MNLIRVKALIKKEFIHIFRDVRSLGMAIAIPILLLVLFGYALTLDVDHVKMAVWDQDRTDVSRDFIRNFSNSRYFDIIKYVDNYRDIEEKIDDRKIIMALVIPKYFSKNLRSNRSVPVQLLVDGSDSNTATLSIGYAQAVVGTFNKRILLDALNRAGKRMQGYPIEAKTRIWFNPDLKSRNYIIPGLIAVIMMVIASLLTSLTVAKEWERGTMEQLISTPVTAKELIWGKFVPYFSIGFLDVLIAVGMGQFMFGVPLRGNVLLLFFLGSFFLTGAMCMGLLISIVMKNQFLASQIALLATFMPSFLLSGFAFSISNMPVVIQAITHIVPARYFVTILKGIYLKGVGLEVLWSQAALLIIFSFITVQLATMKFKKRV